ncbi:MAG: hypothetical protein VX477_00025 [Actinomycetota bacterium]|nr:hypothetical protein [Actinomycetota bacterium]
MNTGTTVKATCHYDCLDTRAWVVTARGGRGVNPLTNPNLEYRLGSVASRNTLVDVDRLAAREGG